MQRQRNILYIKIERERDNRDKESTCIKEGEREGREEGRRERERGTVPQLKHGGSLRVHKTL